MIEQTSFVVYDGVVVPESALLSKNGKGQYGGVPDLNEDELADPEELERAVMMAEWGPVLALPGRGSRGSFRPDRDEDGIVVGAFGSVDFDRCRPELDKARYKAGKLKERLKDILILASIVKERLPGRAKYLVLKYLRMGIIGMEHIVNEDMCALAKMHLRAAKLREEIAQLRDASLRRRRSQARAWLASLG